MLKNYTLIAGFPTQPNVPKSAISAICGFHQDIPNSKTPNLYKKWGTIIQPWQSPQGSPLALMLTIDF